ncbi:MAG: hypothetical protein RLZZ292_2804, partial [Bacteroidota bacterium]
MTNQQIQSIKQRFGIIGRSPSLDHAIDTAARVAVTDLSVLITGESGVGKEAFSRIIHSLSVRKHGQFIAINCGAIPEGTINSELFGHEKGSFTGAIGDRKGYFETVDGGTIFLDEIGEMPLDTQAFLLRVLESGEFIRVGASKTQKTNVRVVAATNVNLLENIRRGKFREDLYYRLNTVPIAVPSLKERREDIYMLFRKFAYDFADKYRTPNIMLEDDAVRLLENYPWPGNIRELKNLADQVSLLAEKPLLNSVEMLRIAPNLNQRNLPSLNKTFGKNTGASGMDERDILYQLLFDMKKDLNDLKKLVFGLINTNDLSVPDMNQYNSLQLQSGAGYIPSSNNNFQQEEEEDVYYEPQRPMREDFNTIKPVYVKPSDDKNNTHFNNVEVVEESLSISDNEKDLIKKALKKHGGRRKEAATDLQMSER